MNESRELRNLIDRVKLRPNSLARNKAVSHMEDAFAHLEMIDRGRPYQPPENKKVIYGQDAPGRSTFDASECTCPDGQVDSKCPVHGL